MRKKETLWERYCRTLDRAVKKAGDKAKQPHWYWSPADAYMAGYRAAQRDAKKR
jgi:hypothetical protein